MRAWAFTFAPTPDAQVGDGELRVDAAPPYVGQVTRLYLDNLDRDGQYVRPMIAQYPRGTVVYLEGAGGAFAHLELLRAPQCQIGYLELPVVTLHATPAGIPAGPVTAAFLGERP
jgi:hypothetical protein